MKLLLHIHLLGFATVFADVSYAYPKGNYSDQYDADAPTRALYAIIRSSNNFGFRLLHQLPSTQNTFLSPISISMLVGMLYQGARNSSAEQIQYVMEYLPSTHEGFKKLLEVIKPGESIVKTSKSGYTLEMANAMLVDNSFTTFQSYKDNSRKYYDAAVEGLSFSLTPEEVVNSVNGWVAWKTRNAIVKVLEDPLEPLTKLFMMNAVYFKGTWKKKFDQRFTMPDTFYNDGLVPKTVPMMRQKGKLRYAFEHRLQLHALEIPYEGEDVKMLILLPEKRDGLAEMESKLSNHRLNNISSILRDVVVQVTLPRFSFTENYDLVSLLMKMGIHNVFRPDLANLKGISPVSGLYVTKAVHMCSIKVNEEGSEATAVTGISAGVRTGGPLVPLFNADHPFMFFIRDSRLDLTLFVGRVVKL